MANTATLDELIFDLRADLNRSTKPQHGQNTSDKLRYRLNRVQRQLDRDFNWPFRRVYRYIPIVSGDRYYDFPEDVDEDRVIKMHFKFSLTYIKLNFGITPEILNLRDSDRDIRNLPITLWDYFTEDNTCTPQFEVWPIPNANGFLFQPDTETPGAEVQIPNKNPDGDNFIRMQAIKKLTTMTNGDERCALDRDLIVLVASAEESAFQKSPDAGEKAAIAGRYFNKIKARYIKSDMFKMGTDIFLDEGGRFITRNDTRFVFAPRGN